ncbi:ftsK [Wigglesworthia glossinidia endosymbiont of Glossina brevipalpis]|uniref:FtsK protein n=1 Tax=Wigglesworthia glossinidia brevipalpis TaxID=36870 RepID=Q8D263_WIGBR|nr:ftsK [Wigglesworthia glossinidia endosymbiont of Glossina brevipalpis]
MLNEYNKKKVFLVFIITLYLLISIISFNEDDPNLLKTSSNDYIFNFGGKYGAYISGTLFIMIGKMTYFIPLFFLSFFLDCCFYTKKKINLIKLSYKIIHMFLLILFCCCFLSFLFDDNYSGIYFGGIIGNILNNVMYQLINNKLYIFYFLVFICILISFLLTFF